MELQSNNHSVFCLNYHLILVIKYRRKVINEALSQRLKAIFESVALNYHIKITEWNHDVDHVHILFTAHPNTELSKFINAYKSASSRLVKNEFPMLRRQLWKEFFWSRSFCLISTGGVSIDTIKKYIQNQGKDE